MTHEIRKAVEAALAKAEDKYKTKLPAPHIRFDLTGTTAGQSNYAKRYLRFNLKLAIANKEDFLASTVPHECAHYVQRHLHGYKGVAPHGREWRNVMITAYGLSPKRCHNYDTSAVRRNTKPYQYKCLCAGKIHSMGGIRHKKILRGAVFSCNTCRTEIEFAGKQNKPAAVPNKFLREEIL